MQHLLTPQFIDAVQADAKVAAAKKKPRSKARKTQKEEEQAIDDFDEVVHTAIDTFCIDDFQADAKVAAPKQKRRNKNQMTEKEQEADKQAKQMRALKKLQLSQPGGKSPLKRGGQSGSKSPSKKHKKN